jgi:hypothetical protein
VKTTCLAVLTAVLALSTTIPCSAQPATKGPGRGDKAAAAAQRLDILKWPAYQGAELVQQISLSESQLKGLVNQVPGMPLRGLRYVAVLSYRLPTTAAMKDVIAFYEPRALAAGYTVMAKEFDPGEESAVYTGPKENILVLSVDKEGEADRRLEIVSVEGPISSLVSMGQVMKRAGTRSAKPARPSR